MNPARRAVVFAGVGVAGVLAALAPAPGLSAPTDPWRVLPLTEGELDRAMVEDVAVSPLDPDRLLAWTGGLLYRSTDGGESWAYVPAQFLSEGPSPPLRGLRLDGTNLDVAWGSIRDHVVHTTDFGRTWMRWGNPTPGEIEDFEPVAGDPAALWIAIASGPDAGIAKTTNGGISWELRDEGLVGASGWAIAARPGHPATLVAGTADGLARTTDDGASWDWVRIGARARHLLWGVAGLTVRAYQNGLVESTDAGLTWAVIPSDIRDGARPYAFDPFDPAQLLLADVGWCLVFPGYGHHGSVRRSTDGGAAWGRQFMTPCFEFPSDFNSLEGAGVKRTGDSAWTWFPPTRAHPRSLQRTTDGGETWALATAGMKEFPIQVFDTDGVGAIYAREGLEWECYEPMRRSTDRGQTWTVLYTEPPVGYFDDSKFLLASRARSGDLLEGGGGGCGDVGTSYVARSTDAGLSWQDCGGLYGAYRAAFNHGSGSVIYVWNTEDPWEDPPPSTRLNRSDDGNLDYTLIGPSPFLPVAALITPEDDGEVFVATLDADPVVHTTDGGVTWHPRSNGLPGDVPVALLMDPTNGDHLAVAFERGIPWESTDRGLSWHPLAAGLDPGRDTPEEAPVPPDLELRGVTILDADWDVVSGRRRVFLATDHGIWASDLGFLGSKRPQIEFHWVRYSRASGLLTAASRRHGAFGLDLTPFDSPGDLATDAPVVSGFVPLSLAPNPFVGSASIRFGLGRAGSARLDVYDPAGRRVATLVDGRLTAGPHAYTWSGRNDAGRSVAPGVYFVRLTTAERQTTQRLVRLR